MEMPLQKKPSFEGIDAILLDLDNTLFNSRKTKRENMRRFAEELGSTWTDEKHRVFLDEQARVYRLLCTDQMTVDDYYIARGAAFRNAFSLPVTDEEAAKMVHDSIRNGLELLPGAMEAVQRLYRLGLPLCIASNGVLVNQIGRLQDVGMDKYFTHLFVSDNVGHAKPLAAFYEYALNTLGVLPERAMMIGDEPNADIIGAKNVGMKTCFIMGKPKKKIPPEADYYVLGPADLI